MNDERQATVIGWTVMLLPLLILAACVATTTNEPVDRPAPTTVTQPPITPSPGSPAPDGPVYGPERDCGDGTRGTFADCWNGSGTPSTQR
ncbi:hypothetical protein [Streptomyces zhihengii]